MGLAQRTRGPTSGPVRIVALLTADPRPTAAGLEMLRGHFCGGTIPAVLLDAEIGDRSDADRPESVRRLLEADLILIGGGDPQRLHDHLTGTRAHEALWRKWLDGAVVAGCSAGAAVIGAGMISGADNASVRLDFWDWLDGSIVAPHFGYYDLDPWLDAYPGRSVIGVPDDGMALIQTPGTVVSLGPHPLTIVDPERRSHPVAPGHGRELRPYRDR